MDAKQVDGRIKRMLGGIRQAFRGKIARTDASSSVQRAQIEGLDGETVQALEHAEQFGFTAQAILVQILVWLACPVAGLVKLPASQVPNLFIVSPFCAAWPPVWPLPRRCASSSAAAA